MGSGGLAGFGELGGSGLNPLNPTDSPNPLTTPLPPDTPSAVARRRLGLSLRGPARRFRTGRPWAPLPPAPRMSPIKFGTDGWRAVIAADYTFDNLETVARATAAWVQRQPDGDGSVVIGHDTRFQGEAFARHAARVFGTAGVRVRLAEGVATTPAVSWATAEHGATAGIVITASHNPPKYNGFKIKAHFGGPATPAMIADVEAGLDAAAQATGPLQSYDELVEAGTVETFALQAAYVALLKDRVDVEAIKEAGARVAYDAMYGAGQGVVTELLGKARVVELGHEVNPGMHGQAPEPIEKNLGPLLEAVVDKNCGIGLATDGDADRIGLVDEEGQFVDSHKILALLVKYLHEERGLRGDIVKTFSTTDMLDRMGEAYGLTVQTTPDRVQVHRAQDGRGRRARRRRGVGRDGGQGPRPPSATGCSSGSPWPR